MTKPQRTVSTTFQDEDFKTFLIDCFNDCLKNHKQADPPPHLKPEFKYTPIQDIFKKKIISKPTFYKGVKEGKFQLIKLGSKSFIDMEQFLKAFHREIGR